MAKGFKQASDSLNGKETTAHSFGEDSMEKKEAMPTFGASSIVDKETTGGHSKSFFKAGEVGEIKREVKPSYSSAEPVTPTYHEPYGSSEPTTPPHSGTAPKKKKQIALIAGIAAAVVICAAGGIGSNFLNNSDKGVATSISDSSLSGANGLGEATGSLSSGSSSAGSSNTNGSVSSGSSSGSSSSGSVSSGSNLTLSGEIPCVTTSYVSNNFGFAYKIPSDFTEYSTQVPENGVEVNNYKGEDAEGNDLGITVMAVNKEKGMQSIVDNLSALRNNGININVDAADSLPTIEKKLQEVGLSNMKSEYEKAGYITETQKKSNGYVFTASLPSEEESNIYEQLYEKHYIISDEFYDNGKTVFIDVRDLVYRDSDYAVQKHTWGVSKTVDCGNYMKVIYAVTEAYNDEDINPSVSKLKYIINQFN